MAPQMSEKTRRIAKNTVFLYFRSLIVMAVGLFTSRVVLATLGVDDFGIVNVVGGVVSMFACISGALSGAISRFLTFELGRGNKERLNTVFSTSILIQVGLSVVLLSLIGSAGAWFLNAKMNIPPERLDAANWVLACAAASFAVRMISVAYNAMIIAHEHMKAFAYASILDVTLKLGIVCALAISPTDKLKTYAVLLFVLSVAIQLVYCLYCRTHFAESRFRFVFDKSLIREMFGFAGWAFFSNAVGMMNGQGINLLMNMFFGVAVNAARGIATQVDNAVMQFVSNFTTSLNPQIIKSYAADDRSYMFDLICRGSKFAFFLGLFFVVPAFFEAGTVLHLWLGKVPEHAVAFTQLGLLTLLPQMLGSILFTGAMATGNIRLYAIVVNGVSAFTFLISWLFFLGGAPAEVAYGVHLGVRIVLVCVRVWLLKRLAAFPPAMYLRKVFVRIVPVTALAFVVPGLVCFAFPPGILRLLLTGAASVVSTVSLAYLLGIEKGERAFVLGKISDFKNKFLKKTA